MYFKGTYMYYMTSVSMNEPATMAEVFKEFAQQQMEGCCGFVFSEDL